MRPLAAALATLTVCAAWANDAPFARIVITPSVMSETKGGSVDVVEVFPDMTAEAGAQLLTIDNFSPGLSMPQRMESLIVTDDQGAVPLVHQGVGPMRDVAELCEVVHETRRARHQRHGNQFGLGRQGVSYVGQVDSVVAHRDHVNRSPLPAPLGVQHQRCIVMQGIGHDCGVRADVERRVHQILTGHRARDHSDICAAQLIRRANCSTAALRALP
jgi:hypothetical protein